MKKIILTLLILMTSFSVQAKMKIVVTLPVFASIVQEVGGDHVELTKLGKSNQDPHFIDPKPSYVVALSQADVLVHSGLEMEVGWLPPLLLQSRNSKIMPSSLRNIAMSEGLMVLEVPEKLDRSQGDIHPSGNPHVWMDPRNVLRMAQILCDRLSSLDPENLNFFSENTEKFKKRLSDQIIIWEGQKVLKGKNIITYHRSFSYLAHWLGLNVLSTIEPKPGIPPSASYIEELIRLSQQHPVWAIVSEDFYPQKVPEYLSEKMKRPSLRLSTQPHEGESYILFMQNIINSLSQNPHE